MRSNVLEQPAGVGPLSSPIVRIAASGEVPKVSVIVPTGRGGFPSACMETLLHQRCAATAEIIVVLDAGEERSPEFAARFPQVRICNCPDGSGPGGARNAGLAVARGEYLAFIDSDCTADSNWLQRLLDACIENADQPVCGWVGLHGGLTFIRLAMDIAERGMARPARRVRIDGLWGSNLCVSRGLLQASPNRFIDNIYGAEEQGLLCRPGSFHALLEPAACVEHAHNRNHGQMIRRMFWLGAGSASVRRRHAVRGRILIRVPVLIPLLPVLRMLLTGWRVARLSTIRHWLQFAMLSPLILCFLLIYTAGFAWEAAFPRPVSKGAGS